MTGLQIGRRDKSLLPPEEGERVSEQWPLRHYFKQNEKFCRAVVYVISRGEERAMLESLPRPVRGIRL
jgi:hypothetical protein